MGPEFGVPGPPLSRIWIPLVDKLIFNSSFCISTLVSPSSSNVTMTLDVPYGDSFNVVHCDTFSIEEGSGRTRMVRTAAIEWLKKTWLKSMIEKGVATGVSDSGKNWVEQIQLWARARG